MRDQILTNLHRLMHEHHTRLLFACESGSRSWGFESPDSDWDIRFVYAHRLDWYLSLYPARDVIEESDATLDFAGWDLKKTLRLAAASNPAFLEWINGPIVYYCDCRFIEPVRDAMRAFSPRALMHHYANLAERQVAAYWRPGDPVRLKKYLYALRPLMCIEWMKRRGFDMPPVAFDELRGYIAMPPPADAELADLLERKARISELTAVSRYAALDEWIERHLASAHDDADAAPEREPDIGRLEQLFRDFARSAN